MIRPISLLATLAAAATVAGAANAGPANLNAEASLPSAALDKRPRAEAGRAGGVVTSVDRRRGQPAFLWAVGAHPAPPSSVVLPAGAGLAHMSQFAAAYELSPSAMATAAPVHVHDLGRGAVVVTLRQQVAGVDVFHSDAKLVMNQQLELVAISGALHPAAVSGWHPAFSVAPEDALRLALEDLTGDVLSNTWLNAIDTQGRYTRYEMAQTATGLTFSMPARTKPVLFPMGRTLVPAHFVEVYVGQASSVSSEYYRYVVSAADGTLLYRENLTAEDSFDYRVWADTTAPFTPYDSPHEDFHPHPTGNPGAPQPGYRAPNLIAMEGFNTNPNNAADPWLPAMATETLGNNVDAYIDDHSPDGFSSNDFRASVTSPGTFDRVHDVNLAPDANNEQIQASITQLFYTVNWLHDWFYDSGFDEAAGNAQNDNFGRGGEEGDSLKAEAQDGGGFNNANMSTPGDGSRPRMQMYLWGSQPRTLDIEPASLSPSNAGADFGPSLYDVTANLVLMDDGTATVTDGCEAPVNNVSGSIVLVDRGQCAFAHKAANVEAAGGVGVIVANNQSSALFTMGQSNPPTQVGIPAQFITLSAGGSIKTALGNGAQTAHMLREQNVAADGTIDNGIVAHEFGHYFHHRLSDGGNHQFNCMGEGWGDFLALYTGHRDGDDINGTYALGIYAVQAREQDPGYFGIRRYPYSLDQNKNALSFRHIQEGESLPNLPDSPTSSPNSEVHAAGEIWASMMWDSYLALVARSQTSSSPYDFATARRRMGDYVVAGLLTTRSAPTYTETRDALLAAAWASDAADGRAIAEAFAGRGAGTCAVSPDRDSDDLVGVVESNVLQPEVAILSVSIDDAAGSCDDDGHVDGGEIGQVLVRVANVGTDALSEAELTVTTTTPGVMFFDGETVDVPTIQPFDEATVAVPFWLPAFAVSDMILLDANVSIEAQAACTVTSEDQLQVQAHFDDEAATTDGFESPTAVWSKTGTIADSIWSRVENSLTDHVVSGLDWGTPSDTAFESPDMTVHLTDPLTISFDHSYEFEAEPGTWWDGGVIEISNDGGMSWTDVSNFDDPGYDGIITDQAGNVLMNRMAYSGTNASHPAMDSVSLDLGTNFAGETVRVRFRIGTDQAKDAPGWLIDNVAFGGITNAPYLSVAPELDECQQPPLVDAGPDQTVRPGDTVTLDASATRDLEGDPVTFAWSQQQGESVALDDASAAITTFVAPMVDTPTTLRFTVTADDGMKSASDDVDIAVVPEGMGGAGAGGGGEGGAGANDADPELPLVVDGGCGCEVVGEPTSSARWSLALLALLFGLRRRRTRG